MAVRQIRYLGDPVLKSKADPVTRFDDSLRALVRDLMETVDEPGRAGLAAPQIGVGLRVFSYLVDGEHGHVVNPELVEVSEERQHPHEGCLSLPGLWFETVRGKYAVVRGVDQDNEPVTVSGDGLLAQCLQHEYDHLDGTLYIDTLPTEDKREALRQARKSDWFWRR